MAMFGWDRRAAEFVAEILRQRLGPQGVVLIGLDETGHPDIE